MTFMANEKYKFIIFVNLKGGFTSSRILNNYLKEGKTPQEISDPIEKGILERKQIDRWKPEDPENYYKVQIYRNPYHRILSGFFHIYLGIKSPQNNMRVKPSYKYHRVMSLENYLKDNELLTNRNKHYIAQKRLPDVDKYVNTYNMNTDLFSDYDKDLQTLVTTIMNGMTNNNTTAKHLVEEEIDYYTYDFRIDPKNLLLNRTSVPKYDKILTPEIKEKMRKYIDDDFYDLFD